MYVYGGAVKYNGTLSADAACAIDSPPIESDVGFRARQDAKWDDFRWEDELGRPVPAEVHSAAARSARAWRP